MNDDLEIRSLLRRAEAGATLVPLRQAPPEVLGARVIRLHAARRARRRAAIIVAAIVLVTATGAGLALRHRDHRTVIARSSDPSTAVSRPSLDVQQLRREIALLNRDAALHEQTAQRLLAIERAQAARGQAERLPDARAVLDHERHNAAMLLLHDGDELWLRRRETRAAAETYRRVIALFPSTYWAAVAQERLARIGEMDKSGMNRASEFSKPSA